MHNTSYTYLELILYSLFEEHKKIKKEVGEMFLESLKKFVRLLTSIIKTGKSRKYRSLWYRQIGKNKPPFNFERGGEL